MHIKFLEDGESPDIGTYRKGDERDLPADIANVFIARGIVEKQAKTETEDKKRKSIIY